MNSLRHIAAISAVLVFISGCSLTPDYQRPEIETPAWREAQASQSAAIVADWWKEFGSDELDGLMARALEKSFFVKET